jgi:CheY-like chemotaxis protein
MGDTTEPAKWSIRCTALPNSNMSKKTILVAEDWESSRELIRTMLEHSGYTVLEATNGAEAVFLARERLPDLVFLDLECRSKVDLRR